LSLGLKDYEIVKDVGLKINLLNCLEPMHKTKPTFKVAVEVPAIEIVLPNGYAMLKHLIELQSKLMVQLSNYEYNLIAYKATEGKSGIDLLESLFAVEQS
jgi:hypothetical protein